MYPLLEQPKKILVRSTNWIGDAVMTTPALRSLRQHFPDSDITLLAYPWVADVFRYSPRINQLFLYEKKARHKGLRGLLQLGSELRHQRYDCAILLQNAFEAALISVLARIPQRCGYATDGRGLLLTHPVHRAALSMPKHETHYYLRLLRGLGMVANDPEPEMFIPGFEIDNARKRLRHLGIGSAQPLIGFNPGAAFGPAKRWPAERYAELAQLIEKKFQAPILLFGGPADRPITAEITKQADPKARCIDLAGATTLIEAMALIGECDAFVTNDSGLMHLAAALHTPQVAIFGSTDHIATGPYSASAVVVRKDLSCSPCKKTHCPKKHFQCMRLITSAEVFARLNELLKEQ